ncbi:MAG TPA: universal stress protein [Nitrososphaeraceae archaeon]|nr:universal stress protein [Nitrososphaeraceae archaeon]
MIYDKILVPFDTSKPSEAALDHAISIAKMTSISLSFDSTVDNYTVNVILLYVVQDIPVPITFGVGLFKSKKTGDMLTLEQYLKDIEMEIKIEAKNKLEDKIKKIQSSGFILQSKVLNGDPAEEILKFSESEKIKLIVMGNVGLKGISKIKTLGSVSRNVLENAKCPVLIVHS